MPSEEWEQNTKTFYNAAKIGIDAAKSYRGLLEAALAKRPVRLGDIERARRLLYKADEIYQEGREVRQQLISQAEAGGGAEVEALPEVGDPSASEASALS